LLLLKDKLGLGGMTGFSSDFKEYKSFQDGESSRNIDWKIFGKTDKLYTKQFYNESSLKVYLILDASSSMFYPLNTDSKLKRALEIMGLLCKILQKQKDQYSIIIISDKVEVHTPIASSLGQLKEVFQKLEHYYKKSSQLVETRYIETIESLIPQIKTRSSVIFLTDLLFNNKERKKFIQQLSQLKSLKNQVSVMHLYDDSEINMINAATHLELIDLETNKKIRTNNEKWREFLIKLQEEKENEIIIPLKEKGIKVSPIRINDSLLMNIRTTF
jgi:uncharacterized protein (DUF58 family)